MPLTFTIPAMLKMTPIINGTASTAATITLTDHNRSALSTSQTVIEQSNRMANGTLRKYTVASKSEFSTDWTDVPSTASYTVDGKAGATEMRSFYSLYYQHPIKLDVFYGTSSATFNVFITSFSATLKKRSAQYYDFYDVSLNWSEI